MVNSVRPQGISMSKKIILIILFSMILDGAPHACLNEVVEIRPVKIKVVDKSTGLPVEGLPVYLTLQTYWPERLFLIFRNPEGNNVKMFRAMEEFVTDGNGEVYIPARQLALKSWKTEKLFQENIFINIDTRIKSQNKEFRNARLISVLLYGKSEFINPISIYRGYRICSTTWAMDPKKYGGTKFEIADALWNGCVLWRKAATEYAPKRPLICSKAATIMLKAATPRSPGTTLDKS